jgi:4-hydroxy-tetrahydrodipicolinate synthase
MIFRARGAYTALITPFRDGEVDRPALADLVERQIGAGIHGLVPCGTTGEASTMRADERVAVIEWVSSVAAGRVPIIAGTGTNDTRTTVEFTKRISGIDGVHAALVVTPYYNKPNQAGIRHHFQCVADDGGLPVVLYNVPGRTGVSMTAATVGLLSRHENIVAVKEASGDMRLGTDIAMQQEDDFALLSGDDFTTLPLLAVGGAGCISVVSNIDPRSMAQMCDAAHRGDFEKARRYHTKIQALAAALFSDANPVPAKVAASMLGWTSPDVRSPLVPGTEDLQERMRQTLTEYGLLP